MSVGKKTSRTRRRHDPVSVLSYSEDTWLETVRQQYEELSGVTVLMIQYFGAQPSGRNRLGYKDLINRPEGRLAASSRYRDRACRSRPVSSFSAIPQLKQVGELLSTGVFTGRV
jgi:hypothetical protein